MWKWTVALNLTMSQMALADFSWPQGLAEHPQVCVIRFDTNTIACDGKPAKALPFQSGSLEETYSGFLATIANLNITAPDCRHGEIINSQEGSLYYDRNPYVLLSTTPRVTCTFYPKGTTLGPVFVPGTTVTANTTTVAPTSVPGLASLLSTSPTLLIAATILLVAGYF